MQQRPFTVGFRWQNVKYEKGQRGEEEKRRRGEEEKSRDGPSGKMNKRPRARGRAEMGRGYMTVRRTKNEVVLIAATQVLLPKSCSLLAKSLVDRLAFILGEEFRV